jgi:hypothetical protein
MKRILLFVLMTSSIATCFAQSAKKSGFANGVTNLTAWIKTLDKILPSIHDKEKLRNLYTLLGNADANIQNISALKYVLAIDIQKIKSVELNKAVSDDVDTSRLSTQTDEIIDELRELQSKLKDMVALMNDSDEKLTIRDLDNNSLFDEDTIIEDILGPLKKKPINKQKIIDEALNSYKLANNLDLEIVKSRNQIMRKLQTMN